MTTLAIVGICVGVIAVASGLFLAGFLVGFSRGWDRGYASASAGWEQTFDEFNTWVRERWMPRDHYYRELLRKRAAHDEQKTRN